MRLFRTGVGVLLLFCSAGQFARPEQAQARRAFEIADFYQTAFVSAPAVSPDGKHVVFAVRRYDLERGNTWSEIWMMASDGGNLRQMTFSHHNDVSPAFAIDGKQLLFVSDRAGGKSQLFTLRVDGGEPVQLTYFSTGVSDPRLSPDGRWIAVTARVYPECGADDACNRAIAEGLEQGRLRAHVADSLLYRHWTSWRDGTRAHILLVDAKDGKIIRDLTPGYWDSPTFSVTGDRGYDFSPDGRELCYVSNHDPDPASSTNADLWIVPVEGDTQSALNVTATNQGWDGSPLYSPDGRYIGYRSQATPGYESALYRLAVYDRGAQIIRYLTDVANHDNWVSGLAWPSDSKTLFFQGEDRARKPIYRLDLETGAIKLILTDGDIDKWLLTPDGRTLIYARSKISEPPEIYRAAVNASDPRPLTRFNTDLIRQVDFRKPEEMWVQGAGNYKVHVFVIKPHGFNPASKYPLILNVHGGPQSQWTDSYRGDWQVYTGKGYVVAFANPTGSTGYGQNFTDAIRKDWGGRVFQDLMMVTDEMEKLPYVDKERMGAMGWSYGGYMTMWFEGNTPRFKALASMMGLYNLPAFHGATEELWFPEWDLGGEPWDSEFYRKWSPSEHVRKFKTPCLVITGEGDFRVPYTQSLEFFTALQKMKVPSKLIVFQNAGHWPDWYDMAFYYNAHLDWFHRWLGGEPAPYDMHKFQRNQLFR